MKKKIIVININNYIINMKIDEKISFIFNKKEIKKFFEMINILMIIVNNNIILKKLFIINSRNEFHFWKSRLSIDNRFSLQKKMKSILVYNNINFHIYNII